MNRTTATPVDHPDPVGLDPRENGAAENDQSGDDQYPLQYHVHDPLFRNRLDGPVRSVSGMPGGKAAAVFCCRCGAPPR